MMANNMEMIPKMIRPYFNILDNTYLYPSVYFSKNCFLFKIKYTTKQTMPTIPL